MTPRCSCHDVEQLWHKDVTRRDGGYWQCRVLKRKRDRAYLLTEKGQARRRRFRMNAYLTRLKELTKP